MAFREQRRVFGDGEGPAGGEAFTAVKRGTARCSVDAVGRVLMPVRIVEIGDDVASGLVDVPTQPRRRRYDTAFRPTAVIGEFVHVVNVDVRGLRAHGLEFAVVLDGQQTLGVPEPFVVGVKGRHGGCRGQDKRTNEKLAALGDGEACAPRLDEQTTPDEVDTNPHQDAGHDPRYRVEHFRYPRFSRSAQQIAVRVQLTEIGPVFAVQFQEDVDGEHRDEPDVRQVHSTGCGEPRVFHRTLLTATKEGWQSENAHGNAGQGSAPPSSVPGEHGLADDVADETGGHHELWEVFTPAEVTVREQHVPVREHEPSLGVGVGCTVKGWGDQPGVEQQNREH